MTTKYIVFIKNDESQPIAKAYAKSLVTHALIQEMKAKGFRKHFVEVKA